MVSASDADVHAWRCWVWQRTGNGDAAYRHVSIADTGARRNGRGTRRDLPQAPVDIRTIARTYQAEQGGARLSLVVRVEGDVIHLERTSREPTVNDLVRSYALEVDASQALSEDAALRRTAEGVLLWERASNVEGIPADWWSLYRRVTP